VRRFSTIVLAGGASSRMGSPKALLRFGGETLIERVTRRLAEVSAEVIVVAGPHVPLPALPGGARAVQDDRPLQGPLAGIFYGLRAAATDLCFVCGCDHPFLAPAIAQLLVAHARGDGAVSVWEGREQPLVAAYRRDLAEVAAELLAAGEHRPLALLDRASLARVTATDLADADPSGRSFFDIDTPEAYSHALRLLAGEDDSAPAGTARERRSS
jgi:molybdopterin-guanine dinucleotide biosynthesis protein A